MRGDVQGGDEVRTEWTEVLDAALLHAVTTLTKAGFNRQEKTIENHENDWCYDVGVWRAVACAVTVLCRLTKDRPSPDACHARWWKVLDRITTPGYEAPIIVLGGMDVPGGFPDLKGYDEEWERICREDAEKKERAERALAFEESVRNTGVEECLDDAINACIEAKARLAGGRTEDEEEK